MKGFTKLKKINKHFLITDNNQASKYQYLKIDEQKTIIHQMESDLESLFIIY